MIKLLSALCILLSAFVLSCKKDITHECLKARIIRVTCASTVIQVLSDDSIGEDGWVDMFNNNMRYDNVFSVSNTCSIPSKYKAGNEIYITISKAAATDCVHCALYDSPPKASYNVDSMGSLPCSGKSEL